MQFSADFLATFLFGQAEVLIANEHYRAEIKALSLAGDILSIEFCWAAKKEGSSWVAANLSSYMADLKSTFSTKYGDGIELLCFKPRAVIHLYPREALAISRRDITEVTAPAAVEVEPGNADSFRVPGVMENLCTPAAV